MPAPPYLQQPHQLPQPQHHSTVLAQKKDLLIETTPYTRRCGRKGQMLGAKVVHPGVLRVSTMVSTLLRVSTCTTVASTMVSTLLQGRAPPPLPAVVALHQPAGPQWHAGVWAAGLLGTVEYILGHADRLLHRHEGARQRTVLLGPRQPGKHGKERAEDLVDPVTFKHPAGVDQLHRRGHSTWHPGVERLHVRVEASNAVAAYAFKRRECPG